MILLSQYKHLSTSIQIEGRWVIGFKINTKSQSLRHMSGLTGLDIGAIGLVAKNTDSVSKNGPTGAPTWANFLILPKMATVSSSVRTANSIPAIGKKAMQTALASTWMDQITQNTVSGKMENKFKRSMKTKSLRSRINKLIIEHILKITKI